MGHYLSDMLPDPNVVCLSCHAGVWSKDEISAWSGYLRTCTCNKPDHCPVEDVAVSENPSGGFIWKRKK